MMRQRGISTVPAIIVTGLAALVASVLMMDWMIVDVETTGPDAVHVKVPLPLLIADVATNFIPDEAFADATIPPEVTEQREAVIRALSTLLEIPDTTLVEVEEPDTHVLISKEGDDLKISVDADDAMVRCSLPLDGIAEALERWDWKTVDPEIIFDILGAAHGNLLTVEAEDAKVVINMW
jgi:hypothetical protein